MGPRVRFAAARIAQAVPLLIGIVAMVFLLVQVTPGDPARALAGPRATPAQVQHIRDDLGLNDGVLTQFWRYLTHVATGDLGVSNRDSRPVMSILTERLPVTVWILCFAAILAISAALPLAILAASHRDRLIDHVVRALTIVCLGMPVFWVGLMLIVLVAVPTGAFPAGGHFGDTPLEHARAVFLPALALAVSMLPLLVRSLRSSVGDVLESDYVAAARALGLSSGAVLRRHVLRNAAAPTVSLLAVQIGYLLFGSVLVENAFDLPGLGNAMITAAGGRDFPVVLGVTLVFAVAVVAVHIAADLVNVILDPRTARR